MLYSVFGNVRTKVATSLSFAVLGIFVYNNYHILPSFDDIKLLIVSKLNFKKTIKETPEKKADEDSVEKETLEKSYIEDPSGNLFSDSV